MTGIELLRMYAETRPRQAIADDCQLPNVLGKDCDDFENCNDCHRFVCNAIADQIERETLPRPRFEDGRPVQFGDEYMSIQDVHKVKGICVRADGSFEIESVGGVCYRYGEDKRLKRPEPPKVLDADGVEIKLGDEVWFTNDSGLVCHPFSFIVTEVEAHLVHGDGIGVLPCQVTHRNPEPPDSWEKLAADIKDCDGSACRYFGRNEEEEGRAPCYGCKAYNDDADCTVQVISDLVRRAKKLAGVE